MRSPVTFATLLLVLAVSLWIAPATPAAPGAETDLPRAAKTNSDKATRNRSAGRVLSDVTLTARVKNALMRDETVSAREINVDTVKGVVHLKGNVDSKAEAQRAVAVAQKVNGVQAVKSHLQIVPNERTDRARAGRSDGKDTTPDRSAGRVASDVTITGKVKSALIQDKTVSAREINVDTVRGIVYLKGDVDSKAEAQKAVALARKVEGVKGVKSQLQLVPNEKTAGYREQRGGSGQKRDRK